MRGPLFVSVLIVGLFTAVPAIAMCEVVSEGTARIVLGNKSKRLSYSLLPRDGTWVVESFKWHADAAVYCPSCQNDGVQAGYVWLDSKSADEPLAKSDREFAEGVQALWFSGWPRGKTVVVGVSHMTAWGRYRGRATRLRSDSKQASADALVLSVWDDCVVLRLYSSVKQSLPTEVALAPFLKAFMLTMEDLP